MPSDVKSALLDIAEHILLAWRWTEGVSEQAFAEDRKTFYAVTRCLEIISEATRRLPGELKETAPNVPWRDIRDAGNFYRHQYDDVLEQNVFDTARYGLNDLDAFIRQELARP